MSQLSDVDPRSDLESDPFALGGDQRDDAALLTLFREWREKLRLANESKEDDGGGLDEQVWAIEGQIYSTPAK